MNTISFSHTDSRRLRFRWPFLAAFAATLLLVSGATAAPLLVESVGNTGATAPNAIDRRYFLIDSPLWRIETIPAHDTQRARLKGPGSPSASQTTAQVRPA